MTDTTIHAPRVSSDPIPMIDLKNIRGTYLVTTMRGASYRVRRDTAPKAATTDSSRAHVLVSMAPFVEEHPQYAKSTVMVGNAWDIGPGHPTSPIKSIEQVPDIA